METIDSALLRQPVIPIQAAPGDCSTAEVFALRVLGDAMLPEFSDGDVIVVEPQGEARDGSFVIARLEGAWTFRQLVCDDGQWFLAALNPVYGRAAIPELSVVRGVVIQKSRPGRRKSAKRYVD